MKTALAYLDQFRVLGFETKNNKVFVIVEIRCIRYFDNGKIKSCQMKESLAIGDTYEVINGLEAYQDQLRLKMALK